MNAKLNFRRAKPGYYTVVGTGLTIERGPEKPQWGENPIWFICQGEKVLFQGVSLEACKEGLRIVTNEIAGWLP